MPTKSNDTRDQKCGFCNERRSGVCVSCCDKTSEDIIRRLESIEIKATQVKAIIDRQRLYAIRFNEVLRVVSQRMSIAALDRYLLNEDF